MAAFATRIAELNRRLRRAIGPLHRARHRGTLRRGEVDRATVQRARNTWWGDDDRWFPGGTPPRHANRVTPLIDGEELFAALHKALTHATTVYLHQRLVPDAPDPVVAAQCG